MQSLNLSNTSTGYLFSLDLVQIHSPILVFFGLWGRYSMSEFVANGTLQSANQLVQNLYAVKMSKHHIMH